MSTPMAPTRADLTLCRANWWGETVWVRSLGVGATERVVIVHVGTDLSRRPRTGRCIGNHCRARRRRQRSWH